MEQYRSVELEEKPVEEPRVGDLNPLFLEIIQTLLLAVVLYFVIDAFIGRVPGGKYIHAAHAETR